MTKFILTEDPDLIKSVWCVPRLWDSLTDDSPISAEEFEPFLDPSFIKWLAMVNDGEVVGILMMQKRNHVTWELHVGFHPDVWGTGIPRKFGKDIIKNAFEETGAKKLIAMIPVDVPPVWKFAKYCGMKIEGTAKRAWQKGGEIKDAYYLGVYR